MKAPFFTTGEYEEKTMGRRELRESIFQLLFMTEFNDNQECRTETTVSGNNRRYSGKRSELYSGKI